MTYISNDLSIAVCEENSVKFSYNKNGKNINLKKIAVDSVSQKDINNGITCSVSSVCNWNGIRCDYMVVLGPKNEGNTGDTGNTSQKYEIHFVELKGTDIQHAADQIIETYRKFKICQDTQLQQFVARASDKNCVFATIVCSRSPNTGGASEAEKAKKKLQSYFQPNHIVIKAKSVEKSA